MRASGSRISAHERISVKRAAAEEGKDDATAPGFSDRRTLRQGYDLQLTCDAARRWRGCRLG